MHADEDRGDHVTRGDGEIRAEPLHDDGRETAGGGGHQIEEREEHRSQTGLERAQTRLKRKDEQSGGRAARVAEQHGHDVAYHDTTSRPESCGRRRANRRDQPVHRRRARGRVHGVASPPRQRRDARRPAGDRRVCSHVLGKK